jgi:hypothetical protein
MASVQLSRACCPETFARVGGVPDVEVADLGAFGGGDADDGACGGKPGFAGARREDERCGGRFTWSCGDAGVEWYVWVEDRAGLGLIGWLRFRAGRGWLSSRHSGYESFCSDVS